MGHMFGLCKSFAPRPPIISVALAAILMQIAARTRCIRRRRNPKERGQAMIHPNYPTEVEIGQWCERILQRAEANAAEARRVTGETYPWSLGVRHAAPGEGFLAFPSVSPFSPARDFHCYWQPAPSGPAPILFHVPGYGAEMSDHPVLQADGYNVMHINPLGYATPKGPCRADAGVWPVLPDTVASFGARGYVDWLTDAAVAVRWALAQPGVQADRFAFFGTSQGGGTALLLGSLFSRLGCRAVAADEPFLTHFPLAWERAKGSAYDIAFNPLNDLPDDQKAKGWRALGYIDTLNHAHRLTMPVLLTSGTADGVCPEYTIQALFEKLPSTRSYTSMAGMLHGYTLPFLHLARAWFRIYV